MKKKKRKMAECLREKWDRKMKTDGTVERMVRKIVRRRDEIIRAFVAKYKCGPDEVIQVEMHKADGTVEWSLSRKKKREIAFLDRMGVMDVFVRTDWNSRPIAVMFAVKGAVPGNNIPMGFTKRCGTAQTDGGGRLEIFPERN